MNSFAILVFVGLVVLACGGDDSSSGNAAESSEDVVPFEVIPASSPPVVPPDSTWRDASINLEAVPSSAGRGSTLEFVVAIANDSSRAIDPAGLCPAYTMSFGESSEATELVTSLLNCEAARSIGPGEVERFAMEIDVPSEFETELGEIYWRLESIGDTSSSQIRVVD